jgi:hypothetical protein
MAGITFRFHANDSAAAAVLLQLLAALHAAVTMVSYQLASW